MALPDGVSLYMHQWVQPDPVGNLLFIHGKGDYGGRFYELGTSLQAQGWSSYAPDLRGFGRTPGWRGWVPRFSCYLQDLEVIQQQLQAPIWVGYSTGANLAVEYALSHPGELRGLVLISPAFSIASYFTPLTLRMLRLLEKIAPWLIIKRRYTPSKVTSLPEQQANMSLDPWITGISRARFVAELWRSGRRCIQRADQLNLPMLILYTSRDQVVDPAGAVEFFQALQPGIADVTLREFPESEHDLLHDRDARRVMQTISAWIQRIMQNS